jgi:hypothetical protein
MRSDHRRWGPLSLYHGYANTTLNQPCIIENTTYINDHLHTGDPDGNGQAIYIMDVLGHNCCSPGLFCDPEVADVTGPTCQPTKELKKSCRFDEDSEVRLGTPYVAVWLIVECVVDDNIYK